MSADPSTPTRGYAVLDFREVPGRPRVVRAYCEGCERYSRPIRKPTEADKQHARERCGDPLAIVYPNHPPGWEYGCPRCES
jgi:hypothetical protein